MMHRSSILVLVVIFYITNAQSQSTSQFVFSSQGDISSDGSRNISWTLGQPIVGTLTSQNTIVSQGFHQPLSNETTSFFSPDFSNKILMYPNPTWGQLQIETDYQGTMQYEVYDIIGRRVEKGSIDYSKTLNVLDLAKGLYTITFHDKKIRLASLAFQKL